MSCLRNKNVIAIVLLAVLGAGMYGCGGGGGGGGSGGPPPVPALSTLSPVGASVGGTAFTLNVAGSGFGQGATVQWKGSDRATTFVSGAKLQANISATDLIALGTFPVKVVDPVAGTSNSLTFTVAAATIAFQSRGKLDGTDAANTNNTQNIWTMGANGSTPKPLTSLTALLADSQAPVWSPDGSKIAYASERKLDGTDARDLQNNNIWVANADGTGQVPLTPLTDGGAESFDPHWSPDGTKIAYVSARDLSGADLFNVPNLTTNIWVMNADGSNQKPLTRMTALSAFSARPVHWSPDSTRLAFPSDKALNGSDNSNSARNIWIVNADGSGLAPLTKITAAGSTHGSPVWSPDGTKIAFLSTRALDKSDALNTNNVQNIWVMNADGSGLTALTQLNGSNSGTFGLAWSPDGAKIAFSSTRALDGSNTANTNNAQNIWAMNADGSSPTHLTGLVAAPIIFTDLAWTAGGAKLLFTSNRALNGTDALNANSIQNVWVIDANGSNAAPLTSLTTASTGAGAPAQP